jgi:hypothetical protein
MKVMVAKEMLMKSGKVARKVVMMRVIEMVMMMVMMIMAKAIVMEMRVMMTRVAMMMTVVMMMRHEMAAVMKEAETAAVMTDSYSTV